MRKSKSKDYLWNSAAGIINAAEAVVMSMVVTRFGALSDAGILSLSFAVGNVLMTIGKFSVRMFQATDIQKKYSFRIYVIQRFITLGLMVLSLAGYLFFSGYESTKLYGIILITYLYMIEVLEDCIWGHFQSLDMLYIGAQMFCSRWAVILVSFITVMVISGNMIKALCSGAAAGTLVFCIWVLVLVQTKKPDTVSDTKMSSSTGLNGLLDLFKQVFPLFAASFCSIYLSNSPKFAIDRYLRSEVQACYGFVAMPVFVIGLLNQFIYQPTVITLTKKYHDGEIREFRQSVKKQMVIVAGILALCVCGASILGIPVLSYIYNTDLHNYLKELIILQFAGGFLALSGYFYVILTIMRKQNIILYGYAGALVLGMTILNEAVKMKGTVGASVGYLIIMILLFMYYFVSYLVKIKQINGGKKS